MKIEDFDYHLPEELSRRSRQKNVMHRGFLWCIEIQAKRSIGIFMTYWSIYSREIVWC